MAITWLTPTDLGVSTTGQWVDVDASAYVPVGATGVLLKIHNGGSTGYFGLRKKGSTDDRPRFHNSGSAHMGAAIGVNSGRVFQAYITHTSLKIYLTGYTMDEAVFFDNAIELNGAVGSWTDADISSYTGNDVAIGAILNICLDTQSSSGQAAGARNNGSTDNRIASTPNMWCFVGVDATEVLELYLGASNIKAYLIGYFTKDVIFNVNAPNISASSSSWADLPALPAGATGGFIEVQRATLTYTYGLRKNGSAENIYGYVSRHCWAAIECDENGIIEGRRDNSAGTFHLTGYTLAGDEPPAPVTKKRRYAILI